MIVPPAVTLTSDPAAVPAVTIDSVTLPPAVIVMSLPLAAVEIDEKPVIVTLPTAAAMIVPPSLGVLTVAGELTRTARPPSRIMVAGVVLPGFTVTLELMMTSSFAPFVSTTMLPIALTSVFTVRLASSAISVTVRPSPAPSVPVLVITELTSS